MGTPGMGTPGTGGQSGSGDEGSRKGTPLTAEEQRWLDEMLDAEKDPAKRREIEEEFKADAHMGRIATYKVFKRTKSGDVTERGTPLTAEERRLLNEMLDAEKDQTRRSEIEQEFRADSRIGRLAAYKAFKKSEEATKKGTPLTAEEQRLLDDMLNAERDPTRRSEIEQEFRADTRIGRVATHRAFRKGGKSSRVGDAPRKGAPLTAQESAWLKEMMDAEKDPVKRTEIDQQFRDESPAGRAARYNFFKKERPDELSAATVLIRAATDVVVTVNGVQVPRKTERDTFLSPDLPPGWTFSYVVTATAIRGGREVTDTKRVRVTAGSRTEVDFTPLDSAAAVARVTVVAPKGTAVRVNGTAYTVSGKKTFETPELTPGESYTYTFEADLERGGTTVTETRRVSVAPGKAVTVDFTERTAVAGR